MRTDTRTATPGREAAGEVTAELTYIVRQDTKPYFLSSALTGGDPEVFFSTESIPSRIADMRSVASGLCIDVHGFELRTWPTGDIDLHDDDDVEARYEPDLVAMLRTMTGADTVAIFDHTRRSDRVEGANNPAGARRPASRVHVDYTVRSGPQRARDALGELEVDRILGSGGRIVQVNVWRPMTGPVLRAPLALADAASIPASDLVATDQRFPDRVGEIYQLAHGPGHRWYYAPEMTRDEVILIKGWDSLDDGRARFTPHGAFVHPGETPDMPARESIETRTYLVFEAKVTGA